MKNWLSLFVMGLATSSGAVSSKIPDQREFPINTKINPCENFYEYACSKTIEDFKLRDDRSIHTFSFSDSRERLLEKKKEFLQSLPKQKNLKGFRPALKNVYMACTDTSTRANEEKSLVTETIAQLNKIKSRDAFLDFLAEQRHNARFSFIDIGSGANKDNPDYQDFYYIADMMSLPERSYYEKDDVRTDYLSYLEEFFTTIGDKNPKSSAKAVLEVETQFAKNYPLPHELRKIFSQKTSISRKDLLKTYPTFRLEADLKRVPEKTNITHFLPDNFVFVNKLLAEEDLAKLKAVYKFQALSPIMDEAYPKYFATKFDFSAKHMGGPAKRSDLAERCTKDIMGNFRKEIDFELVDEVFPNFPEEKFIALAETVRGSIIDGIKDNEWLSEDGKKGAIKKIKNAKLQLVKPRTEAEWYFNPKLEYNPKEFLGNKQKLDKAKQDRMFAEIGDKRDKTRWWMGPLTINAYYSPSDNKFVMPIGILQPPFYDPSQPQEVNLGAVGAVIGHELGHGIDDNGAKYDFSGRLTQWMPNKDIKEFKKRGEKMVSQFDGAGHNGKLTLGENIGDLVGLSFAYDGAFPNGKGSIENKQKFFLQYARVWCSVIRPKFAERLLKTDSHSLGWARVNEQVKHQPGFHEAYSCKKGHAMYLEPEDRIRIW
ncbi:M13 family metallopeptidase [Pseudobacteriovorax antillogorgiicola]|uniref:Endothelin-converting enzyme Metallo peptidase. MEROPS family M13 n=1 Tax=Pseudobacteriovorax antillogorgiicola TaxID=1513793 RepID=A0A1Y6CXK7_9BACT|nr:M13 family metallopeptidase [Pseudobacteriovorax antillogorgiicola]TCS42842.1 endothelin-converting enzyme [Pseudobacteriovorax antillogorgiicola]SMF81808.1 endothelin-converting enzyme Metallo peptidase. MEROPS family M13 [Pseudobacteriovorax antillogorgiicola]